MKTFLQILILGIFFQSSVTQAKDLKAIRTLKNMVNMKGGSQKFKTKPIAPLCENFTGRWQGTCVSAEEAEESTLNIVQEDCENLQLDGFGVNINGSVTFSSSPSPDAEGIPSTVIFATQWNDAQTQLYTQTTYSIFNGVGSGVTGSLIWISGEQLRMKDQFVSPVYMIDGSGPWTSSLYDCTYTRVSAR